MLLVIKWTKDSVNFFFQVLQLPQYADQWNQGKDFATCNSRSNFHWKIRFASANSKFSLDVWLNSKFIFCRFFQLQSSLFFPKKKNFYSDLKNLLNYFSIEIFSWYHGLIWSNILKNEQFLYSYLIKFSLPD